MAPILCPLPWWADGRVTSCVVDSYLNLLIPLMNFVGSLVFISIYLAYGRRYQFRKSGFERLACSRDGEVREKADFRQYRNDMPRSIQALEAIGLTAELTLDAALFLYRGDLVSIGNIVLCVYLLALVIARDHSTELLCAQLQTHSVTLYLVQWLSAAIIAHRMVIDEMGGFEIIAASCRLVLLTGLVLFHWTASRVPIHELKAHNEDTLPPPGPTDTASLLSRLSFSWVSELLWTAYRAGPLQVVNLDPLSLNRASAVVDPAFHSKTSSSSTLLWRIAQFLWWDLLKQGVWAAVSSIAVFIPPLIIRLILQYLESPVSVAPSTAWLYVFGLLVSGLVAGVADCQCGWIGTNISTKLRTVLLSQIYAKVLRKKMARPPQSSETNQETRKDVHITDGAIFNLVSGDVDMVSVMSGSVYLVWVIFPVQITIGTWLLYKILGISGVVGVMFMIVLLPLNVQLSKQLAAAQRAMLTAGDTRIQASNELLQTIRTIKYYAWEAPFRKKVLDKREEELKHMRTRFIWWSISMTVFYSLQFIVTILTCFFYTVVWNYDLGTSVAFPALATFAVLRIPLNRMADSITFLIQAHVSLVRIEKFLQEKETEKKVQLSNNHTSLIGFQKATLSWSNSYASQNGGFESSPTRRFILREISIEFKKDALNVICGPSGSGKSSLLLALLGEMHLERGRVFLPYDKHTSNLNGNTFRETLQLSEAVAYCPHEPWILNQSIRANILLGLPFDERLYEEVVRAVALHPDVAALRQGDQTLAGENGSRLSGGQKQRISLARAIYSGAKYVILDDCLSAVDSRTANHIFFHAIKGPLMRGKTCVLATHHMKLVMPYCDFVVMLDSGRIEAQGIPAELAKAGCVQELMFENKAELLSPESLDDGNAANEVLLEDGNNLKANAETSSDESKFEGAIPWSIIQSYLTDMGRKWFWVLVICGFAAQQLASLGTNLWIKEWAAEYDKAEKELMIKSPTTQLQTGKVSAWYYLSIYVGICLSFAVITFIRDMITFWGSLRASKEIYERLLDSILSAKIVFFDRPLGQITNRFSKDIGVIDQSLASFSVSAFQIAASVAMVILVILSILPGPLLMLVLIAASLAYYYIMIVYLDGARDLKRIEAVARSPLYQQIGESIAGCVSIRAYGREDMFTIQHHGLVDMLNQPYLLLWASKQWLTMRINVLSSIIAFATGVFVLWTADSIDAGAAGLVLTYASTFTENMLWFVQIYAIIQQNLTSLERIVEYNSISHEEKTSVSNATLPSNWPTKGTVSFSEFKARYAPHLDLVLKGINFKAKAGQRVAVVGRTGAGKSSIALALLRALEADGGSIDIDGIDIKNVTLQRLRETVITVVPQDPQLFDGSVRVNLDPLGQHSDEEMTETLRLMQQRLEQDRKLCLDDLAAELSRGQRQLLCVARGLLRQSRILVLDEATSSIDHAADSSIQAGLRSHAAASGTTVITIAHRLITIADYDHVVVLDAGLVVEQGTVTELLSRCGPKAHFRYLCAESGDLTAIEKAADGRLEDTLI
jgi:ABC-type multidrug transport system fused ATPase/permease subunit